MSASAWFHTHLPSTRGAPWRLIASVAAAVFALGAAISLFGESVLPTAASRAVVAGVPIVLLAWLIAAPLVAVLTVAAGMLWSARSGTLEQVRTLTRVAERWAIGERAIGALPRLTDPDLRTLAAALSRLTELREASSAMLVDRDTQLAAMRNGSGIVYWESDFSGRYTRLEMPQNGRRRELAALLGRQRWDDGAQCAEGDWASHSATLARLEPFERLLVRRTASNGDAYFMCETGWPRYAADGTPIGYAGTMQEIPAEEASRQDQRLAAAAFGAATESVLLLQATSGRQDWRIRRANPAACRLLDRPERELQHDTLASLLADDAGDALERLAVALERGDSVRVTTTVVGRYGDRRTVNLRLEPIDGAGRGAAAVLLLDDLGPELARLREAVGAAEQSRDEANARSLELEVAARELESFGYTVSHDLRAPLRVVDGFARIVQEDYAHLLDRVGNEHLNRILSASARMNAMIDALLALSRVASQPVVPEDTDLTRLAQGVVDELRAADPQREVSIAVAPDMKARCDASLMRVVLQNLVGNAWKYTAGMPGAEISIGVEQRDDDQGTVYVVRDNGVGFDMRFADRLFGVFQRLHSASEFPGHGVGLATVQRIVRRHGGRVWADSAVGEGSRFYFTLGDRPAA